MAVTKRQGREKLAQTEQSKVKGRSEDRSEDFRWNKQRSWLAHCTQGRPKRQEQTYEKRSQRARSLSFSDAHTLSLSLLFASLGRHALTP